MVAIAKGLIVCPPTIITTFPVRTTSSAGTAMCKSLGEACMELRPNGPHESRAEYCTQGRSWSNVPCINQFRQVLCQHQPVAIESVF